MSDKGGDGFDIDAIIKRMHQVLGVGRDTALAKGLGLGSSAPANWRLRSAPPFAVCAKLALDKGVSLDWLLFGVGEMRRKSIRGKAALAVVPRGDSSESESSHIERIIRFARFWEASQPPDEAVWLELQIKRTIPEYAQWLASQDGTT